MSILISVDAVNKNKNRLSDFEMLTGFILRNRHYIAAESKDKGEEAQVRRGENERQSCRSADETGGRESGERWQADKNHGKYHVFCIPSSSLKPAFFCHPG